MTNAPTSYLEYATLLSRVPLFAGLHRVTLSKLAAYLEPVHTEDGKEVVRYGEPSDALYLITSGSFAILVPTPEGEGEARISTVSVGDTIGEMGLLTEEPRSATVRADGAGALLRLGRHQFLALVREDPSVALSIAATLSGRLRSTNQILTKLQNDGVTLPDLEAAAPAPAAPTSNKTAAPKPQTAAARRWRPSKPVVGMLLAAAILAVGWVVPPPAGLSESSWRILAGTGMAMPLLAMNALPEAVVSVLIIAAWVLGGGVPARTALIGFASPTWLMLVLIFAIGSVIAATGVIYRLALWAAVKLRAGFVGQVLSLGAVGLLSGPALPSPPGRLHIVAPALEELSAAFGYAPHSRAAIGLAMATLTGFGLMVWPFMTSSSTALLLYTTLPAASREGLSWSTWALRAAPLTLVLFGGLLLLICVAYRPRRQGEAGDAKRRSDSVLALQRELLGDITRREVLAGSVITALLLGFATQPLHGVEPLWLTVLAFTVLGAAKVMTADTFRTVNWSFLLLLGALGATPEVFANAKVDAWLATLFTGLLQVVSGSSALFLSALAVLSFALSSMMRWQPAALLLAITLAPMGVAMGIDPWVVAFAALVACNGFHFPHMSTTYLALYEATSGRMFSHAEARPLAVAYLGLTILALLVSIPFWSAMGLL